MTVHGFPEGAETCLSREKILEMADYYRDVLISRGRTPGYVRQTHTEILKLLAMAGYRLDDSLMLMAATSLGRAIATTNKYIRSIKSFSRWLSRPSRRLLTFDPLADLPMRNARKDRRHERGIFTDAQLRQLLETTAASPRRFKNIPGADRAEIYHLAVSTGLRAGTLRLLEAGQFDLLDSAPSVRVRADQLKDEEDLIIPLESSAASRIHRYIRYKASAARVLTMPPCRWDTAPMIQADLEDADIEYCRAGRTARGEKKRVAVLDFHALRHTFASRWLSAGVPLATVQRAMGHSDPKLTANIYNHLLPHDLIRAVALVPPLPIF